MTIHATENLTARMTLGQLEKELDDRFYRAGRSVLVNLTQISRVTKTEIRLNDGTLIPLPREQRVIRVYMDMKNTQLYISFTNFTAGKKMKKEGKRFRSTKGEGHGFGLARVDTIVERLDGYISRNSEDGAFTTAILLPQL